MTTMRLTQAQKQIVDKLKQGCLITLFSAIPNARAVLISQTNTIIQRIHPKAFIALVQKGIITLIQS